MERQAIMGTDVLYEHTFPVKRRLAGSARISSVCDRQRNYLEAAELQRGWAGSSAST
jgi:hypothetical protein